MNALIASDAGLTSACTQWSTKTVLGLDTEFFRERTYYPRPALIQVADDEGVALVDPLAVSDFAPLDRLLADPTRVILMHSCGEDLEVFERLFPSPPTRIFDTQLAAAFTGYGFSLGYSALVAALLGVELDKGETRSDWLRRPLSESQQRYAALDVMYLAPMHDQLSKALVRLGRADWVEQEFEFRRQCREVERQPEAAYLKVSGRGVTRAAGPRGAQDADGLARDRSPDTGHAAPASPGRRRPRQTGPRAGALDRRPSEYSEPLTTRQDALWRRHRGEHRLCANSRSDRVGRTDESAASRGHAETPQSGRTR